MTDLARLIVKLEAQTSQYQAELEKANRKLASFEKSASQAVRKIKSAFGNLAGALAGGALLGFVKQSLDAADRMKDVAEQTGLTVEQLSRLNYAATQSGADLDTLTTGLRALGKQAAAASEGSDGAAEAFAALGISVTDSSGAIKATDTLLLEIAGQLSKYEDGLAKSALAQRLFGRGGAELLPFLNQGAEGIAELTARADALGLTLTTQTAAAADQFNDNLATLKAQLGNTAATVGAGLVPVLNLLVEQFTSNRDGASALKVVTDGLVIGLKILATIGYSVWKVFEGTAKSLGALAAAAVAVAQGEFSRAASIIEAANEDEAESFTKGLAFIEKLWTSTGESIEQTAAKTDSALKKSIAFGGGATGGGKDKGKGFDLDAALEDQREYFDGLDELTQTSTEKAVAAYEAQRKALDELWAAGRIGVDTYNARLSEFLEDTLQEVEVTSKRVEEKATEAAEKVSTFADQAARNTVDIIADGLRNGFEDGAKGVLDAVARMLIDITAQIVAADLGKRLFGDLATGGGGGGGGGNGILGSILGGIGNLFGFGGARDSGGRGQPGMAYMIGTGAQPEIFVPDTAGEFYPAGAGGMNITQHFTIQAPGGTVTRQTEMQIGAAAARGLSTAARRNN